VRHAIRALAVDDDTIRDRIRKGERWWGETWDSHSATAVHVRERIGGEGWVLVATAHPAKFESIVEPLIGRPVPVPPLLQQLLTRPSHCTEIEPTLEALRGVLGQTGPSPV
jgi:threonine synthase